MDQTDTIGRNIDAVRSRIAAAALRAGRDPSEVTLIAVTKTHPAPLLTAALAMGVADFGENRVAEADEKIPLVGAREQVRWHLIGHLQRNKAHKAAELFDLVHSLDSVRLAEALDRHLESLSPDLDAESWNRLPVLLQINIAGEAQKEGFDLPGGVDNLQALPAFYQAVERIAALERLEIRGLMTIAPYVVDPEAARPTFRTLRHLRDHLAQRYPTISWNELSMGMTGDYEVAVEEGATLVRVGRAIFGERSAPSV